MDRGRTKVEDRIYIPKGVKEKVLAKSKGRCCHCGKKLKVGDNFTLEHAIPLSKGGTNDTRNLVALCFDCNQDKADYVMVPSDYYGYLLKNYKKELEEDYNKYIDDVEWISYDTFFSEDRFIVESRRYLKCYYDDLYDKNKGKYVRVKREFRLAKYFDLNDILEFTEEYNRKYLPRYDAKEFVSNYFENGFIYFSRNSKGKVGMVVYGSICKNYDRLDGCSKDEYNYGVSLNFAVSDSYSNTHQNIVMFCIYFHNILRKIILYDRKPLYLDLLLRYAEKHELMNSVFSVMSGSLGGFGRVSLIEDNQKDMQGFVFGFSNSIVIREITNIKKNQKGMRHKDIIKAGTKILKKAEKDTQVLLVECLEKEKHKYDKYFTKVNCDKFFRKGKYGR